MSPFVGGGHCYYQITFNLVMLAESCMLKELWKKVMWIRGSGRWEGGVRCIIVFTLISEGYYVNTLLTEQLIKMGSFI